MEAAGLWRQQVLPKHWYLSTKLHDVTSQIAIIWILLNIAVLMFMSHHQHIKHNVPVIICMEEKVSTQLEPERAVPITGHLRS
jgi:hypothetical protein